MRERPNRPTSFGKARPRVLVIDDDSTIRAMLERVLRELGCRTVSADSAAAARRLVTTEPNFALVIVDRDLGDAAGLDLVVELEGSLRFGTPFAIFSASTLERPAPAAVVAVIPKPSSVAHLMTVIKNAILMGRRAHSEPPAANAATESGAHVRGSADQFASVEHRDVLAGRSSEVAARTEPTPEAAPTESGTRGRTREPLVVIEEITPVRGRDRRRER